MFCRKFKRYLQKFPYWQGIETINFIFVGKSVTTAPIQPNQTFKSEKEFEKKMFNSSNYVLFPVEYQKKHLETCKAEWRTDKNR